MSGGRSCMTNGEEFEFFLDLKPIAFVKVLNFIAEDDGSFLIGDGGISD